MDIGVWLNAFGLTVGQVLLVASVHAHLFLYKKRFSKVKADISALKRAIRPKGVANEQ